jgi:metal-responsive CopG/Arc/MetJ family transcriptional regulator
MVRIPEDLIQKLEQVFPELKGENNAYLVRTALRKFLEKP